MAVLPSLLRRRGTDEYVTPASTPPEKRAAGRAIAGLADRADERRLPAARLAGERTATAVALRALDAEAGGGFFAVSEDAERDDDAAAADFDDPEGTPVVDVQTHLVNPGRYVGHAADALSWFLGFADADRWGAGVDPHLLSPATWASLVFGQSETAAALITLPPGVGDGRVIDNDEVARCRALVDEIAGPDRVRSHAIVHPNLAGELEMMGEWARRCDPSGWKAYPLFGEDGGWRLDDEIGDAFLNRVEEVGPSLVAVHKGISGPVPDAAPVGAAPHDVGPAAAAHPSVTFLVYHSGYEPLWTEGPFAADNDGVDALLASLAQSEIGADGNVYAELGSTWQLVLRKPVEAAHLIGKLLSAVGDERILWGTDSVWYGSPQPLIDAFRAFTIPEWMQEEFGYPALTAASKRRILSSNAANVYDLDPQPRDAAWVEFAEARLARIFA
jgi:predicted TIM-barrel fold metal-dependent hydrolase